MNKSAATIFVLTILIGFGCRKIDSSCMVGETIGKIRSAGGGLAVKLDKKYKGSVKWQGDKNVIELMNIPDEFKTAGSVFYFSSRSKSSSEFWAITADGDESIELILIGTEFSSSGCP